MPSTGYKYTTLSGGAAPPVGGVLSVSGLADAVTELGSLATAFAAVNRTCCYWPDQVTPESDTDHTVMLAWIAPALAELLYPDRLDTGLVAEFAVLHDAVEVFVGDTPTLRITEAGLAAKAGREKEAAREWHRRFSARLPWVADRLGRYERQEEPETRFVRTVDKQMTRIIHMGDRCAGLHQIGMTTAELADAIAATAGRVAAYASDFPEVLALADELARRTIAIHAEDVGLQARSQCTFCGIADGREPAQIVREWPTAIAFSPRHPVIPGHVLVIPRAHAADAGANPAAAAAAMAAAAELQAELPSANIITSKGKPATQTVYHMHLHVVPREDGDGLALPWTPRLAAGETR